MKIYFKSWELLKVYLILLNLSWIFCWAGAGADSHGITFNNPQAQILLLVSIDFILLTFFLLLYRKKKSIIFQNLVLITIAPAIFIFVYLLFQVLNIGEAFLMNIPVFCILLYALGYSLVLVKMVIQGRQKFLKE